MQNCGRSFKKTLQDFMLVSDNVLNVIQKWDKKPQVTLSFKYILYGLWTQGVKGLKNRYTCFKTREAATGGVL